MKRGEKILKAVLEKVEPTKIDLKEIREFVEEFSKKIRNNLKNSAVDADIFVGGSFAKDTVIKKDKYDVDIFVRYSKKYKNSELSELTKKIMTKSKIKFSQIHGSRDYFRISTGKNFFIEVIPVKKINKPEEYENITDLSYFHVKYINKKIKSKKIIDDIKIAKAFCYGNGCYGAESYISGFSGYSLELLIYYYNGFENFIKAMLKVGKDKLIIDIEKKFKNKKHALLDLNSSKLNSPVILIDPTFKQRNALAALNQETFEKFQKACREFLKNPSINAFEIKKANIEKIKENAIKRREEFALIEAITNKQEGDVAGSKLLKFYNYFGKEISKFFIVKNRGFDYSGEKSGKYFFVAEKKKEVIYSGPYTKDSKNSAKFKKEHKEVYEKSNRLYAKEKVNFSLKEFLGKWKLKNKHIIREMYIDSLIIVN
jgi:tRNA nucleotidyltransferase (CCA-adding enzyme)